MKVPLPLTQGFGAEFEALISNFAVEKGLMIQASDLKSKRFLARSVIPHVRKLSLLFNRDLKDQSRGLDPYWKESANPANLRLAYFLYFMPSNLYRVASIWAELQRLGFRWKASSTLRAIELGAGPASGACGIAAGEFFAPTGLPQVGNWALIEQDKAVLELGAEWAQRYFEDRKVGDWGTRTFHRRISLRDGFLPSSAPRFNLWLMSYALNEFSEDPRLIAEALLDAWDRHLEDDSLILLVEPALKLQSRKLLQLRKALLEVQQARGQEWLKVLLPCLGHQACGALAAEDDWCHEEVSWWRPPYFSVIDQMAGLDRKSLPFSYLVLAKTKRAREEFLPALGQSANSQRYRLVSPAHGEGRDLEFFVCGQEGKRRARYRPDAKLAGSEELNRGDVLLGAQIRGDSNASRIESITQLG